MERPWMANRMDLTPQEIFNIVWNHFVVEGNPRAVIRNTFICTYHTKVDGVSLRCAVGLFLTNEEAELVEGVTIPMRGYCESMKDYCADPDSPNAPSLQVLMQIDFVRANTELLRDMQHAHDYATEDSLIPDRLRSMAGLHGLKVPEA